MSLVAPPPPPPALQPGVQPALEPGAARLLPLRLVGRHNKGGSAGGLGWVVVEWWWCVWVGGGGGGGALQRAEKADRGPRLLVGPHDRGARAGCGAGPGLASPLCCSVHHSGSSPAARAHSVRLLPHPCPPAALPPPLAALELDSPRQPAHVCGAHVLRVCRAVEPSGCGRVPQCFRGLHSEGAWWVVRAAGVGGWGGGGWGGGGAGGRLSAHSASRAVQRDSERQRAVGLVRSRGLCTVNVDGREMKPAGRGAGVLPRAAALPARNAALIPACLACSSPPVRCGTCGRRGRRCRWRRTATRCCRRIGASERGEGGGGGGGEECRLGGSGAAGARAWASGCAHHAPQQPASLTPPSSPPSSPRYNDCIIATGSVDKSIKVGVGG